MLELLLLTKEGYFNISDYVGEVIWSGNYKQASRTIDFKLHNFYGDIQCGNAIAFTWNGFKLFDGYIETRNKEGSFKAVDGGFYLNRNKVIYDFKNITPEAITKKIASDFNLTLGNVSETRVNITRKYISKSIYEVIIDAYSRASEKLNKKYMIIYYDHKLNIIEKGLIKYKYVLDENTNVLKANFSESITNMVNRVLIYNSENKYIGKSEESGYIEDYGLMQEIITLGDDADYKKESESKIKGPEQKASIEVLGDKDLITGRSCMVRVKNSDLIGKFYIESDTHTFTGDKYITKLVLNYENLMDEKDIAQATKEE